MRRDLRRFFDEETFDVGEGTRIGEDVVQAAAFTFSARRLVARLPPDVGESTDVKPSFTVEHGIKFGELVGISIEVSHNKARFMHVVLHFISDDT